MKMTKAILKALFEMFEMYCYTQCTHLAVHDYILKGKLSSSFTETGQDTPIYKECFHFDNYNGLMNLLQKSDKFEIGASPAVSFIAEDDEDAEDEPPPGDDLPDDWDTFDQQQKQQYFLKLQKGKRVQSKMNAPRNVLPQTPEKSQMLKEKIGVNVNRSSSKK